MVCLARTVSLAIVLLLGFIATAVADCAWVLWAGSSAEPARTPFDAWRPVKAYPTEEPCLKAAEERTERRYQNGEYVYHSFHICLPDTVDPRARREATWVLWAAEWFDAGLDRPAKFIQAVATQADCFAAMQRTAQVFKETMRKDASLGRDPNHPWSLAVFGDGHSVTLHCLPDTVDPRGRTPK